MVHAPFVRKAGGLQSAPEPNSLLRSVGLWITIFTRTRQNIYLSNILYHRRGKKSIVKSGNNEKIIQKIYNKTKEKISNLKYEEVKSELSNKSIQELELIYKMLPLPLINNEIIYKNKKTGKTKEIELINIHK